MISHSRNLGSMEKPSDQPPTNTNEGTTPKPAVRHAETRRIATCAFANRIATVSVEHYRRHIPKPHPPATCVATLVCHDAKTDQLTVAAIGVGTKFLMEQDNSYGRRVRDCHAEVLCRRAFRRFLTDTIIRLERKKDQTSAFLETVSGSTYRLRDGLSLHCYCSSTPCGNSTIKKFATFSKETYDDKLPPNTWPETSHSPIECHSIPLGQLALLLKHRQGTKDDSQTCRPISANTTSTPFQRPLRHTLTPKQLRNWPIYTSTSWCPPGTTPVWNAQHGSHTCSDKIARWQVLGWQGGVLEPKVGTLRVATITVGRKFSASTSARAFCCRVSCCKDSTTQQQQQQHPTVMGTSVYLDDSARVVTDEQQRFHSRQAWVGWLKEEKESNRLVLECLDAYSGWLYENDGAASAVSTARLVQDLLPDTNTTWNTVLELRAMKRQVAPAYETRKDELLTHHRVLRDWSRREFDHLHNERQSQPNNCFLSQVSSHLTASLNQQPHTTPGN